ncbi:MAG: cytochrome c oxidase accessory protein CcoG [Saprospiraceae bacterium]|nr:cytochrome c oxidase accessory protein CcoG [Saprospiraceae bacterium]MDW8483465.1 cytochrome c oxidase accessory protein CcoG [Saprospiraceae bacterium]
MTDVRNTRPEVVEDTESFRDSISTVDAQGRRIWIYPKQPQGRYYTARKWTTAVFVALFLVMPFIKIDGEQFLLLNVIERKFVLFGMVFSPQDFHLFVLVMLTFFVFIILFTVVYGRLFCGWVCPQTVFMEMIFRRIEYWIEGDAGEQRRLDKAPWTAEKIRKKGLKHALFFGIAVLTSNYFLAYIIGMDEVLRIISEPLSKHWVGFLGVLTFSGVFYFVFARLREQVCTTICPYGRLQGVLLVKDTIVVAYDYVRGEPRAKMRKNRESSFKRSVVQSVQGSANNVEMVRTTGDCIDCHLCVAVCPTAIDIRNGTQLECINCTACIDACDQVMDKIGRPRGLIRYDSMTGIESGRRRIFTPRVLAYTAVLLTLVSLDVVLLAERGLVEAIILRSPGQTYQERSGSRITNLYTFTFISKANRDLPVELRLVSPPGDIQVVGQKTITLPKGKTQKGAFFVEVEKSQLKGRKTPVVIEIWSEGKKIDRVKTAFMGPEE